MAKRKPTPAKPLSQVLKEKGIMQKEVQEVLGEKYDMPVSQGFMTQNCQKTMPGSQPYWTTLVKCLDEEFGIGMEKGGWQDIRPMTRPPKQPNLSYNSGLKLPPVTSENRDLIKQLLKETVHAYKQPRVRSDEELTERWNTYFNMCAERGQIPTVEEMALYAGYTTEMLFMIETGVTPGFSPETKRIIKLAKSMLKTFDAKYVITGKLNFLTYCFRAKNYYGMVDRQEYTVAPQQKAENDFSAEDLRKRYALEATTTLETTTAPEMTTREDDSDE